MKKELNPIVVVAVIVVLVAVVIGGYAYFGSPHPPAGVKYTPGVPPWMEKGAGPYKPTPDYPPAQARGRTASGMTASGRPNFSPSQGSE